MQITTIYTRRFDDEGRLAFVEYLAGSANFRDAGSLIIPANQVRDKKGNFASPTVFEGLNLYPY